MPVRAYALMILLGIVVGVVITERRWVARGGTKGQILDIALWAVPFGIIGARLYHVSPPTGTATSARRARGSWRR